jgi:phosphatidylcholine synthase
VPSLSRAGTRHAAWAVHAFTATGLVLAALAAVLIVDGSSAALHTALQLLLAATVIDAVDGTLARRARVAELLPQFDGRRLDDIIDFHTYTSLPLLLLWRAEALPAPLAPLLLIPLLASAYGFAQTRAKTVDGYFVGFPSYWNVVALYVFLLQPPAVVTLPLILLLAALTFVPSLYLYPSMSGRLNRWAAVLGVAWALLLGMILLGAFAEPRGWLLASLAYPAFYRVASWVLGVEALRRRRPSTS